MFWLWMGIVITLALIEIITVNLTTVWFVISGIIAMFISLFTDNYYIQFAIFVKEITQFSVSIKVIF